MRDEAGKWIFGFNRFIGSCFVFEVDLLEVATAIQEGLTGGSNSALVKKILQRVPRFNYWSICHIPREVN
ncbi:hypothetical protein Godav_002265 [Gossypium davidsonii]|uniref:RNase H type-1 domain-containing protein n=1 Tax=Gossypium davidsonii TaxID=34287 RepID=A0A7J8SVK2_GOSDV|nr:hypothetical protein [Gossypium davidsonii]